LKGQARARFDSAGHLVLLRDQDRGQWDRDAIATAAALVATALRMRRPGPYQIQAAIAASHAEAASWAEMDWRQIWALYGVLYGLAPSPIVALNRAIALRHLHGPEAALADVEALAPRLDRYHLYHATRAELLRAVGRDEQAQEADRRALELTANPAERGLLARRLADPGLQVAMRITRPPRTDQ
jgi:RNA polymerase sigma-70 factor (ECF subfamily)